MSASKRKGGNPAKNADAKSTARPAAAKAGSSDDAQAGSSAAKSTSSEELNAVDPPHTLRRLPGCRAIAWTLLVLFTAYASKLAMFPESGVLPAVVVEQLPPSAQAQLELVQNSIRAFLGPGGPRPGESMKLQGRRAHFPVVFVPGIVSTALELWSGCV